ncbi:uncharacterized protein BDFB_006775, partial [Asbolus verrucosus]
NEAIIVNVITELKKFFSSKNYIKNKTLNSVFDEQLKNVITFLILNTELKKPLDEPGYEHLINIMPQLSICLLTNIIFGLDLCKHYCKVLERFPLEITTELLAEVVPCLKKCKPKIHLTNAHTFLHLIILKLSAATEKVIESAEKLTDQGSQMLLNLTGLHGEQTQNIQIDSVYECLGYTILNLLDLLLTCNEQNKMLTRIVEKILKTCCSIMMAVTIDVFCCWAEIEHEDQVLQTLIAGKSYLFIEKYQKYAAAKELIGIEDVSRLLNMSTHTKDIEAKKMVIKCASTLELDELIMVTTRHFYQNGINNNLSDDIQQQAVLLFNKIKDKSVGEEFSKELHLLLLQNPEQTLSFMFSECIKNTFYVYNLKNIFPSIREIASVNSTGINALNKEIASNTPNEQNCKNYIELLNALVEVNFYTVEVVVAAIILPLLQKSFSEKDYELLKYGLEILNSLKENIFLKKETEALFSFLFNIIKDCRCKFMEFDIAKQEVVKESVEIIEKCCDECIQSKLQSLEEDVNVTKNICRLLKDIPEGNLKSEEGLSLANLLSNISLRSLRTDKKFACLLVSINESRICQMLAQ